MKKINKTSQAKSKPGDFTGVKDYEHMGVTQAERRMYTYFKTAKEKNLPLEAVVKGPLAGKIMANSNKDEGGNSEFSEQMFTFLSEGDLEKLIAAGGKKGKGAKGNVPGIEKVEYMQKDEMNDR